MRMSGEMVRYGKITKHGNGYVRALLVQAAWALIRSKRGGTLKAWFGNMTAEKGLGGKKPAMAVARRMAELLYVLLRDGSEYEARPFMGGPSSAVRSLPRRHCESDRRARAGRGGDFLQKKTRPPLTENIGAAGFLTLAKHSAMLGVPTPKKAGEYGQHSSHLSCRNSCRRISRASGLVVTVF